MTTTLRAALAALAFIGALLVASPAQAEELPPCAPTAIVFDFCTKIPDVEYPGEDGGTVTPRPEDIIGTVMLCPDGSYGTVIDLDYTLDCTDDPRLPAPPAPSAGPPTPSSAVAGAPAATAPDVVPAAAPGAPHEAFDVAAFVRQLFGRIVGWLF